MTAARLLGSAAEWAGGGPGAQEPIGAQLSHRSCVSLGKSFHLSGISFPRPLGGIKFVFLFICHTDGMSRYDHMSKCFQHRIPLNYCLYMVPSAK